MAGYRFVRGCDLSGSRHYSLAEALNEAEELLQNNLRDVKSPIGPQAEVWHHWNGGNEWWMPIMVNGIREGRIVVDDWEVT